MNINLALSDKSKLFILMAMACCAGAVMLYKPQMEKIGIERKKYEVALAKIRAEDQLIADRKKWEERYEKSSALMPSFQSDQDVDTHWLMLMDSIAASNHVQIIKRQSNKEVEVGDVYEFPIDCKEWEATLKSMVDFLWALNAEGAMLDVRHLFIRPINNKPGYLRGQFMLNCAYMRD